MKKSFRKMVAFGLLVTAAANSAAVADDLFSEIHGTSVFVSQQSDSGATTATGTRITNAEDIARLLREAGLEATASEGNSVSTTKKIDSWEFPVLVIISETEKDISVVLGLSSIQDAAKVPAEKLLGLLEANQKYASAHFVFNRSRQRTEVVGTLRNEAVTGLILRDEINRLAVLARDTADVWKLNPGAKPKQSAVSGTGSVTVASPVAPSTLLTTAAGLVSPLKGRWTAVKSNTEAFAVEFTAEGTFVLVYVNQGKQIRSSGTFLIASETLTFSGEKEFKLSGSLKTVSDAEFQFRPSSTAGNTDPLIFKRAR